MNRKAKHVPNETQMQSMGYITKFREECIGCTAGYLHGINMSVYLHYIQYPFLV